MRNEFDMQGKVTVVTDGTGVLGNSLFIHLSAKGALLSLQGFWWKLIMVLRKFSIFIFN